MKHSSIKMLGLSSLIGLLALVSSGCSKEPVGGVGASSSASGDSQANYAPDSYIGETSMLFAVEVSDPITPSSSTRSASISDDDENQGIVQKEEPIDPQFSDPKILEKTKEDYEKELAQKPKTTASVSPIGCNLYFIKDVPVRALINGEVSDAIDGSSSASPSKLPLKKLGRCGNVVILGDDAAKNKYVPLAPAQIEEFIKQKINDKSRIDKDELAKIKEKLLVMKEKLEVVKEKVETERVEKVKAVNQPR